MKDTQLLVTHKRCCWLESRGKQKVADKQLQISNRYYGYTKAECCPYTSFKVENFQLQISFFWIHFLDKKIIFFRKA